MRAFLAFLAALAMLGSLPLWWWLQQRAGAPAAEATGVDSPPLTKPAAPAAGPTAPAAEEPEAATPGALERPEKPPPELITGPDPGRSPLADRLNASDGSIELDLAIVQKVLTNHLLQFGSYPVGANREITAQLSGRNPRRHAPLPPDLSAINESGELVDRWGTPFFFHALSAREMEIRSAGPDRELYTADDAVLSPAPR